MNTGIIFEGYSELLDEIRLLIQQKQLQAFRKVNNSMHAKHRTVLVTGTSRGFGLLASVALAQAGYTVYATMRNLAKRGAIEDACGAVGVSVAVRELDVTKPETIAPVVEEIGRKHDGPDVLVNNAGFGYAGYFEDTSNANFEDQLATNFYGALHCTRAVLPGMRRRRKGLVLNVSSQSGRSGLPALSAYTASKFALEGWSEALRFELSPFGISVVLLEPGVFRTDICSPESHKAGDGSHSPDSPYCEEYQRMERASAVYMEKHAGDPQVVARRIVRIVGLERPKLRYLVGIDARLESFFKAILPSFWFEKLVERSVRKYFS